MRGFKTIGESLVPPYICARVSLPLSPDLSRSLSHAEVEKTRVSGPAGVILSLMSEAPCASCLWSPKPHVQDPVNTGSHVIIY